jgi:hypothetical protein
MQAGSGARTPAELNQPVLAGDRLWVPERSRVEIVLADRNLLRIDGGSEVVLERLAASPDSQDRGTVLRLREGNIQLIVLRESLGDELPRIETPNTSIYVQDYGTYRVSADQERFTELVVREGRAEIRNDRDSESLRADEQAWVEDTERIDVESAGSYDNLERWARRLDEEGRVDSRYVDEDLRYAAAPLARYGSWIDYQGTSYWRPRVDAGWRPYYNGRWAYTPSGNTWVSYDPWGWVPHHYGSWDYLPGYGWVWQPGRRWAPAWVYWYQGPSYTGWCPTGYYTRYYGSRWGGGLGFNFGVYGWAGGDWGLFGQWTFVSSDYWHGYRDGYRDGRYDGRHDDWRNRWNVQRYAVPIDELRRRGGVLDRGLITTDTRPLTPEVLENPRHAVEVLSRDASARRRVDGRADGQLPDVNDFIARKPDLDARTRRAVVADGDVNQLDGTPLRPDRMDRRGSDNGRYPEGVRGARALPGTPADRDPGQPRVIIGDGGDSRGGRDHSDRPDARAGSEGTPRSPRTGGDEVGSQGGYRRPDPGSSRPADSGERGDRGGRAVPRDSGNDSRDGGASPRSGRDDGGSTGYRRPDPGSSRPADSGERGDRGGRAVPRDSGNDSRDGGASPRSGRETGSSQGYRRPEAGTSRPADRSPRSTDSGGYSRPEPRGGGAARPESGSRRPESSGSDRYDRSGSQPRSYEPRGYERPSSPSTERGSSSSDRSDRSDRPTPRTYEPRTYEPRTYEPRTYERPSSPSTSRGGSERPSSPSTYERSAPPPSRSSGSSSRGGYDAPSRPEPRMDRGSSSSERGGDRGGSRSSDRGSSSRGSSEGRSARRPPQER